MLAVPHAYTTLEAHGRAALLYGRALETFSGEIDKVDSSIDSIREGRVPEGADARGDSPGQELGDPAAQPARLARDVLPDGADGVARLPDRAPELPRPRGPAREAGHRGRRASMPSRTSSGCAGKLRAAAAGDRRRISANSTAQMRVRLEQRKPSNARLQAMLTAPRPDYLATADERTMAERLDLIAEPAAGRGRGRGALELRARRSRARRTDLAVQTEYHERLTAAHVHLHRTERGRRCPHGAVRRVRPGAAGSNAQLCRLRQADRATARTRRRGAAARRHRDGPAGSRDRDGRDPPVQARRERLVDQQTQARYAVADSYDRATAAPAAGGGR